MAAARIDPLHPPYAAEVQTAFDAVMRGAPPIALFRTVGRNPRVLARMIAGGLLDRGSVTLRQRELMILRMTARCGAEYEWGVHVAGFAARAGLDAQQWQATASGADPGSWSREDALVLELADALYAGHDIDDALWQRARAVFDEAQLIELLMLGGQYHGIALLVNALRLPPEPGAPRFPQR